MAQPYDAIILGLGAMGTSAAFHLASRGASVLGLEQFSIPHALGSSHGDSRMIRLCYYEHPDYVPLLKRAYELWDALEKLSERKLLHITGGVYMGAPNSAFVQGSLHAARQHNLPRQKLDRDALRRKYPQFHVPDDFIALFEPSAGMLLPERVVSTHAEWAMRRGAELHGHETVLDWSAGRDAVRVETNRGSYQARHLIICGGAWSTRLVRDLGVSLIVTRQVLGWVWPKRPQLFEFGTLPVWAIDNPDGTQHYGFPMLPEGGPGFKIAHHFHGQPTTPEAIDRIARPEEEADFRGVLQRFIPDADGPLLSMRICMYTISPDSHFIIDRHPLHERVLVACGFSGHGFKFASVVGEVLADMAIDGRTRLPIGFLGLKRFQQSQPR